MLTNRAGLASRSPSKERSRCLPAAAETLRRGPPGASSTLTSVPSLLLHLCAVEELAGVPDLLSAPVAKALAEDLEYARLGTALPDLPRYEGVRGGLQLLWPLKATTPFAQLFHRRAPVTMGLKFAELVANGALVGREPGLAFACGYFCHLALDRVLGPPASRLAEKHRGPRESLDEARRRVEWTQALFYLEHRHGRPMVGEPQLRESFRLGKRRLPTAGVGRGLYELIRLGSEEALQASPDKRQVDRWVRGAFLHGLILSSPLAASSRHLLTKLSRRELFSGEDVDVPVLMAEALASARRVLERVHAFISRGLFSRSARERFLADFPEGELEPCAA